MNKNISVWRGDKTPPTNYHMWLKQDNSCYIHDGVDWKPISDTFETIQWNNRTLDSFTKEGDYLIKGTRTGGDSIPILNNGTINAKLTVLASENCVTQILTLLNVGGGEGNVYIRTKQNDTWKPWGKLQTNVEVGMITQTEMDNLVDNGIYSGVLSDTGETFVIICINNYAIAQVVGIHHISHLKYSLVVGTGEVKIEKRTRDAYGFWTKWEEFGLKIKIDSNTLEFDENTGLRVKADTELGRFSGIRLAIGTPVGYYTGKLQLIVPIALSNSAIFCDEDGLRVPIAGYSKLVGAVEIPYGLPFFSGNYVPLTFGSVKVGTSSVNGHGIRIKGEALLIHDNGSLDFNLGNKSNDYPITVAPLIVSTAVDYRDGSIEKRARPGVPVDTTYFGFNEKGLTLNGKSLNVGSVITWDSNANMNDYKALGVYEFYGERTNANDNLPINNSNPGHSIAAKLTVVDSSLKKSDGSSPTENCITQFLQLSNRTGEEGNSYVRTFNSTTGTWTPWLKQMGIIETYINSDTYSMDFQERTSTLLGLNAFINNGIYSGIYTSEYYFVGETPEFLETFVLIVINDYVIAGKIGQQRHITQLKYAVDAITGQSTVKKRVGVGNETILWSDWASIEGGGEGITLETDPIFSASPAFSITEAKKAEWDNKVDKIEGKQLSTEDFTTALKDKLNSLINSNKKEVVYHDTLNSINTVVVNKINIVNFADSFTINAFDPPTNTTLSVDEFIIYGISSRIGGDAISLAFPDSINIQWANGKIPTIESCDSFELSIIRVTIDEYSTYKGILTLFREA